MPQMDGIEVDVSDFGEVELRLRKGGVAIPARLLCEGTLRMLGLLALVGVRSPPAMVGFEEPENGIHPRRIERIAELLRTRADLGQTQYIVTTHSPLLPERMPDGSLLAVRRIYGRTRVDSFFRPGTAGIDRPTARATSGTCSTKADGPPVSERILRGDFDT